jgi:hypothetical protein
MANLELVGPLTLVGTLDLVGGGGGKVLVGGAEALVENAEGMGVPVLLPPNAPADAGTKAVCLRSLGSPTMTAGGKTVVTTGLVLQGNSKTWPGMLLPSTANTGPTAVTANGLPVNVLGDRATVFPNGGSANFAAGVGKSGQ